MKFRNPNDYWRHKVRVEGEAHVVGCLTALIGIVMLIFGGVICAVIDCFL